MHICKKCGEYRFDDTTSCSCVEFTVIDEDGDKYKYMAEDEYAAAEKHVVYLSEEFLYSAYEAQEVIVNGKAFNISAEQSISYTVDEI